MAMTMATAAASTLERPRTKAQALGYIDDSGGAELPRHRKDREMIYFGLLGLGVAIGRPIAVIGAGIGQGNAAAAALQGMARQPEMTAKLQTVMIIALAIIESLVIYALLMFFMLQGKLPTIDAETAKAALTAGR